MDKGDHPPLAPGNRPAVLVVDDDPAVLRVLVRMLSGAFQVHAVATTAEAEALLAATGFVAVISDYQLDGDHDGLFLLGRARELQPAARRILHTGTTPAFVHMRREASVMDHLVRKPALPADLLAVLPRPDLDAVR